MPRATAEKITKRQLMSALAAQMAKDPELARSVEESRRAADEGRTMDLDEALDKHCKGGRGHHRQKHA